MGGGVIAVPCREQARWSAFWGCVSLLDRPPDTDVWEIHASSPAANRNALAHRAVVEGKDWIFWLDDDLAFRPDTLMRLLQHDEAIVCALSLHRMPEAEGPWRFPPLWFKSIEPVVWQTDLTPQRNGLVPLAGSTSGGLLTRTHLFAGTGGPWWTIGQFEPTEWHDDVWFSKLTQAAGYQYWGDPTVRMGHSTGVDIWPDEDGGAWRIVLTRQHQPFAALPVKPLT